MKRHIEYMEILYLKLFQQDWINRLPRRLLGYHTPEELFKEQIAQLLSAT